MFIIREALETDFKFGEDIYKAKYLQDEGIKELMIQP